MNEQLCLAIILFVRFALTAVKLDLRLAAAAPACAVKKNLELINLLRIVQRHSYSYSEFTGFSFYYAGSERLLYYPL